MTSCMGQKSPKMRLTQEVLCKILNETLRGKLLGALILPDDPDYDTARKGTNPDANKKPTGIVKCKDQADVIYSVDFGRQHGLTIVVRGGGTNPAGFGVADSPALVIDLSLMNNVKVNPTARTVEVGGGAKWYEVDHAAQIFGLAVPSATVSTCGVGGVTLGGGLGYLSNKYGLTCDSLVEADVVIADGKMVTANRSENADLFWALHGGGGNFGVVTSFTFKAHSVSTIYGGPMLWPINKAEDVIKAFQDMCNIADSDTYMWLGLMDVPPVPPFPKKYHLEKMCIVTFCHLGTKEEADKVFGLMRGYTMPVCDLVTQLTLPTLSSLYNPMYPPGLHFYWKGDFFDTLDDVAISKFAEVGPAVPNAYSGVHIYPIKGALSEEKEKGGSVPLSCGNARFSVAYMGCATDVSDMSKVKKWVNECHSELHVDSLGYGHVLWDSEKRDIDEVRSIYGENFDKLVAIKDKYDPGNLFHVNQNIRSKNIGEVLIPLHWRVGPRLGDKYVTPRSKTETGYVDVSKMPKSET